jgi:adenine-specific DNA-methyltransferase
VFQKSESFNRNLLPRTEEQNKPYKNDDNDGKGLWRADNILVKSFSPTAVYPIVNPNTGEEFFPPKGSSWRANKETMERWISENRIFFGKDGKGAPQLKRYLNEVQQGKVPITWWSFEDAGHNDSANRELGELFESKTPFDTPKPVKLLKLILQISTNRADEDLILDFFAGSATISQAVMALNKEDGGNRKYICVQLPELTDEKTEAYKAGYKTIADISKERIRRASKKIQEEIDNEIANYEVRITNLQGEIETEETKAEIENQQSKIEQLKTQDLGFKVLKLADSNFKQWQQIEGKDAKALAEQMKLFIDPVSENATIENMVYELLLKSGKDINSQIEKQNDFYTVNSNELFLLLEKATQEIIDTVIASKPQKVIALDKLFSGNDQLKTNTALQMRDAGVEFKTI